MNRQQDQGRRKRVADMAAAEQIDAGELGVPPFGGGNQFRREFTVDNP